MAKATKRSKPRHKTTRATKEEMKRFREYMKGRVSFDLPYTGNVYGTQITGTAHLTDSPWIDSWTDGVMIGAFNGTYRLDKDDWWWKSGEELVVARARIEWDVNGRELRMQVDTRQPDGHWSDGDWIILCRW